MIMEKECSKCGKTKSLTEFGNNQSTNTGGDVYFRPECKECTSNVSKGKTQAFKMAGSPCYPEIGCPCDLCGRPPRPATKINSKPKKLVFDHGHVSLNHRGWLCDNCNRALGMLGDDEESMVQALLYIAKGEKRPVWFIEKIKGLLKDTIELGPPEKKSNTLMEYYA